MIGQRQSERDATTGGLPFHLGRLSLRARAWFVAFFVLAVAGCASPERLPPVPSADTARALPLGLANARFFPLAGTRAELIAEWEQSLQRQRQALGLAPDAQLPDAQLSRHFRRRRQRRVRFRPPGRLDRSRRSPRVSGRDGGQHRGPDRPVRIPRAGLRSAAPRRLHDDLGRRRLQRARSHRRHLR